MANFEFNSLDTGFGTVTIYVGGTTSTTTINANLTSISDLVYDFTDLESFQLGNVTLTFNDYANGIRTNLSSIYNQAWIVDVDGTKYFEGKPLISSIRFSDNINDAGSAVGKFSLTLGADLLDTSGSYSGLTSYDTDYYALSDVIEQTIKNNTSITSFNFPGSLIYSANGEDVYLRASSAGASDAFIAIKKTAVHSNTNLNGIFNMFGLKLAIWKNTCYVWRKDFSSTSSTITETDVVGSISYEPYQKLDDFFTTSTIRLVRNWTDYTYIVNSIESESYVLNRGEYLGDSNTRVLDGDDMLPIWKTHSFGNWTTSNTDNGLNRIYEGDSQYGSAGTGGAEDNYDSDYWTTYVLFDNTDTCELTLGNADYYNTVSTGATLKISADVFVSIGGLHSIDKEYNFIFTFGSGESKSIPIPTQYKTLDRSSSVPIRLEFEYNVIEDNPDLVVSFSTTDDNWTSSNTAATIQWTGSQTNLNKTNISNDIAVGEYLLVENATQSAFDGVYKASSVTTNQVVLDRDPYTSDTSSYTCDYQYDPLQLMISDINISLVENENAEISTFDSDINESILPVPYVYEKDGSSVLDGLYNIELRYDILSDANAANLGVYGISSAKKRLTFRVADTSIDPVDVVTFSEYGVTGGYIMKFGFDFNKGHTILTVVK